MGVTYLWEILKPICKQYDLEEISKETVCVDLSIWMHQSRLAKRLINFKYSSKLCLRTIFYRFSKLLLINILPVCVFDGNSPEMKAETIKSRLIRIHRRTCELDTWRSMSCIISEKCATMVGLLGIPCVQSEGEAEATCAALNKLGLVNGCITEDGDCFLHGAQKIYRNFSVTSKKLNCYNMDDIESQLGLSREKLVVLALLLGCDYHQGGVPNVGKALAMRFLKDKCHVNVLQRLQDWMKPGNEHYEWFMELNTVQKNEHCSLCGHIGQNIISYLQMESTATTKAKLHPKLELPQLFDRTGIISPDVWIKKFKIAARAALWEEKDIIRERTWRPLILATDVCQLYIIKTGQAKRCVYRVPVNLKVCVDDLLIHLEDDIKNNDHVGFILERLALAVLMIVIDKCRFSQKKR